MGEAKGEKNVSSKHLKMSEFVLKMLLHDSLFFSLRSAFSFFFCICTQRPKYRKSHKIAKKETKKERQRKNNV